MVITHPGKIYGMGKQGNMTQLFTITVHLTKQVSRRSLMISFNFLWYSMAFSSSNAKTPLRSKPCDQVWQLPFSHGIRSKGKKFTASIWCFARIKWKRFKKGYIRKRHWGLRSWPHASCQLSQQGSQPWIINAVPTCSIKIKLRAMNCQKRIKK